MQTYKQGLENCVPFIHMKLKKKEKIKGSSLFKKLKKIYNNFKFCLLLWILEMFLAIVINVKVTFWS